MRNIFFAIFALLSVVESYGLTSDCCLGDNNQTLEFIGYQKKETYDVAVFLSGETFQGIKLKAVNIPINAEKGIDNYTDVKVWLATELKLDNNANMPDIASYDASIKVENGKGIISYSLPEEYYINENGVYVGYSFTVARLDAGTRYPLAVYNGGESGSFFLHTSKSVRSWYDGATYENLSSAMCLSVEADYVDPRNVSITSLPEHINSGVGKQTPVDVNLVSTSEETIYSLDFEYNFESGQSTYHKDLLYPISPGILSRFSTQIILPPQNETKTENLDIKVIKVNGKKNFSTHSSFSAIISVFSLAPIHQTLIEGFVANWSGYSPREYASFEYMSPL